MALALDTCHFGIHVHSIEEARAFYVDVLGFELLQHMPALRLMAVRVGDVRLSMIADVANGEAESAARAGGSVIFRTDSLEGTTEALRARGVTVPTIAEAPGFMRFLTLRDPSGNLVQIAEYLRDPLQPV
jgi:catechol 2,3-dioxygenase-like lactoylglutathione lyase family enzyme